MKDGAKKMSRFKSVVPLMVYVDPVERKKFNLMQKRRALMLVN